VGFAPKQAGDQKAGDDEEHVHADETATYPGQLRVKQHYRHHSHRAQTLDVGAESHPL